MIQFAVLHVAKAVKAANRKRRRIFCCRRTLLEGAKNAFCASEEHFRAGGERVQTSALPRVADPGGAGGPVPPL